MNKLYFIIPCYNEEECVYETYYTLFDIIKNLIKLKKISEGKILFVNDKSTDNTEKILKDLCEKEPALEFLSLKENCGQQKAIIKGLEYTYQKCDFIITIDCDLQDDTDKIAEMTDKYLLGAEVVYGIRKNRNSDTYLKRITAEAYYSLLKVLDKSTVENHGDFRLMKSSIIPYIIKYCGKHPYLRGLIPQFKFKSDVIYYNRFPRKKGKSKYNIIKMIKLSCSGIYTALHKSKISVARDKIPFI